MSEPRRDGVSIAWSTADLRPFAFTQRLSCKGPLVGSQCKRPVPFRDLQALTSHTLSRLFFMAHFIRTTVGSLDFPMMPKIVNV